MADKGNIDLLGAYLIVGEDHLKRDRAISRMRERLEKLGDLSFNSDTFEGSSTQGTAIVDACKTLPFASEKRLVVVADAEKLPKALQEGIVDYLKDPCPTTVLMLVSDKLSKASKLYKAVVGLGKNAIIDCTPPKARDLPAQVRGMAPSHGITITPGAAKMLVDFVGEDTVHLDGELEKIATSLQGRGEANEDDVRRMVSRVNEPKPWFFVDAFADRNMKEAMRLLSMMPSASPRALLRQCVTRIRELICAKSMEEASLFSQQALSQELGVQDWRVKNHRRNASRFTMKELEGMLVSSMECERKMNSGANEDAAFKEWFIKALA